MKKRTPVKLNNRHTFRFQLENGEIFLAKAKVKPAKKMVSITLTEEHALQSLKMGGQGNTQKCAMTVCSRAHGDAFPHPFFLIDWFDTRAYFVTKVHPETKLPSECVVYTHSDTVAKEFDTKAGLKKLLAQIRAKGPRTITLSPPKVYAREPGRPRGIPTGERKRLIKGTTAKGALARFHRATMGAVSEQIAA